MSFPGTSRSWCGVAIAVLVATGASAVVAPPASASTPTSSFESAGAEYTESQGSALIRSKNGYQRGEVTASARIVRDELGKPVTLKVKVTATKLQYFKLKWWGLVPPALVMDAELRLLGMDGLHWHDNDLDVTLGGDIVLLRNGEQKSSMQFAERIYTHEEREKDALTVEREFALGGISGVYEVNITPFVRGMYWGGSATDHQDSDLYPQNKSIRIAVGAPR
ncbi:MULTISPECIES: hypothetical protein [Bacteria]|uniref:hypothetical protein n=1 Tax=Bacteria TaxID=2 RepID=UPI003C7B1F90